jgi:ABC-type amino acid transport substrate-binding protein
LVKLAARRLKAGRWALAQIASRGTYAEIYLKYFPVGFY